MRCRIALVACAIALGSAESRAEFELRFLLVNDFGTFSPHHDNLYTGALGVSGRAGRMEYGLMENTFTDDVNQLRFDETWVTVSADLLRSGPWNVRAQGGGVHVGEGILGETFQNHLHELVGSDAVSLPYIEDSDWYGVLGLAAERSVPLGDRLSIGVRLAGNQAFGFKGDALAVATVEWKPKPRLVLYGDGGARYTGTELAELEPWIDGLAPAATVGLRYEPLLDASYNFNDFGTEDHHWRLLLTWRLGRQDPASRTGSPP